MATCQDMFTKSIKKNVEGTSTPRDENGSEVGAIERNMPRSGDEETDEEANEDNILNLLQTVPVKQLLNTWIDAVGLGLDPLHVSSVSSTTPTPTVTPKQTVETPEFEQIFYRVLDQ